MDEIFQYLESADKPYIVAIDEFQQILKYPEKNVEAMLRTHIQHGKNTQFIYAGSQRHLMENMFFSASRPLFQGTLTFLNERQREVLNAIAKEIKATGVISAAFIKKHGLQSSSSVQSSIRQLLDKEIITVENNTYHIYDRFFGLWLTKVVGTGYSLETIL